MTLLRTWLGIELRRQWRDRIDLDAVRRLPGVLAISGFNGYTGFGVDEAPDETVNRYLPADTDAMRTVERPAILAGRLADPARYDEAVVTPNFVETRGLGVGDQVTLRLFTSEQVETGISGVRATRPPKPLGPTVPVRIVGIVRSPWLSDSVGSRGQLIPSPALGIQYSTNVYGRTPYPVLNALVRLEGGAAAVPAFRAAVDQLPGRPPFELVERSDAVRHWREIVAFESGCLLAFGLCALLVGVALVSQAVSRSDLDAVVLLPALLLVPALVYAGSAANVALSLARATSPSPGGHSAVARAVSRSGLAVPVQLGVRFALEPEKVQGAVLVRPAVFGAVVATKPERFGQLYDAMVGFGCNGHDLVPVQGVAPRSTSEVMLAPRAALRLGAGIGSTVRLTGAAGEGAFVVSGIGFVPETDYNGYDDGALLPRRSYDRLFGSFFVNHLALVTFAAGEEPQAVLDRLAERIAAVPDTRYVYPSLVAPPKQLAEIRNVRLLPIALGAFLVLFAISAVGHALAKAVRHRRRELGVLRAVGMTPWQARGVLLTQATVLAGIGLLVGVPLGIAAGRVVWRTLARLMPVAHVPPDALWVVLVCVPVALVVANLLAAQPGEQAARLRLGQVLRAE